MKYNTERQKEHFKNHKAELFRYPEVDILRFKNPESREYEINFLFDKKNYTLTITGDLGTLVAQNESNMSLEKFHQFLHNPDYFYEKVLTMSRPAFVYDMDFAKEQIKADKGELIAMLDMTVEEQEVSDIYQQRMIWLSNELNLLDQSDFWRELFSGFNEYSNADGWNSESYDILTDLGYEGEKISNIGRVSSGILELYLMAFELAAKQVGLL